MLLTDLPEALRAGGCRVEVDPGFRTRGQGQLAGVRAIMCHHTGSVSANTWKVVRDGREGLRGLLSQLVLERDGLWRVLGSGQAWHAGSGGPLPGIPINSANSWTVGIEAVSAGTAKGDWTPAQLAEYPRGVAALCRRYGLNEQQVVFHKTWAPTRKVDLAGWPGDLPAFRASVRSHLAGSAAARPQEGFLMALSDAEQREVLDGIRKLKPGLVLPARSKNCRPPQDDQYGAALNAWADAADARATTAAILARLQTPTGAVPTGPVALTDADVARVAAAVVDLLSRRTAS